MDALPPVRREFDRLHEELRAALGGRLTALAVHGSAARGEHLAGRSNLDVVLVLEEASPASLAAARPVLSAARRRAGVAPFVLARGELTRVGDVFPLKLLDIRRHHLLLEGSEPFAGIEPTRGHQRLRMEQSLRNHLLRVRRAFALFGDEPAALQSTLRGGVGGLRVELEALCRLSGRPAAGARFREVFDASAQGLGVERATLSSLEALREGCFEGSTLEVAEATMELLERCAELADGLDGEES